ncbi:MAG TPA: prephenate dehydratase [Solirubrobacteraceae bacterium]|jgi:prephenate dehydratase
MAGERRRRRVGYLGPEGTFTEEALLASAAREEIEPVAQATIYDTVMALERGHVEWAIVPIENSLDGSVSVTLDLLAEEHSGVEIVGETRLGVRHSLIAAEALELGEIDTVFTHPQVPGQCERFLHGELPHARVLPTSSTAEAVRIVAGEGPRGRAALGTKLAAELYGGTVIREGVQDREDNETRFAWLARRDTETGAPPLRDSPPDGRWWKTSLVFWGAGAGSPGWLVRCLDEFARRKINLTKIESRPERERLGHYMFFVDLEGSLEQSSVADGVEGLRAVCKHARVLGSYPADTKAPLHSGATDG